MCSTSHLSDDEVSERFKNEHSEQFQVLVRMHLSFLLNMNTEESEAIYDKSKIKKWNIPFSRKSKTQHTNTDIAVLTQEGISQVYQLIAYLKRDDNLKYEGIFRKSGSVERQQELKSILTQGTRLELDNSIYSVHDCATVLKGYLAGLPEPLLTDAHFPVYCQIAEICSTKNETSHQQSNEPKLLRSLQLLLLLLPSDNKALFKDILELLRLVSIHEEQNKMNSANLAKLFTPHLLCPRKLTPENLLKDSQNLFGVVSFMISNCHQIFRVPSNLVLEFRAHYEKERKLSPSKNLNVSVNDAVSTVFTFVDKERTAKENMENPTETALAQLYAHIQSLPESSKKRKLVKQFNKENGNGTPLQVIRSGPSKSNMSFGDSLKKRVFNKKLVKHGNKKFGYVPLKTNNDDLNSPHKPTARGRLFCHNNDESSPDEVTPIKKVKPSSSCTNHVLVDNNTHQNSDVSNQYLTSTPAACIPLRVCSKAAFTPDEQERKSMSPITRSAQRMPKAMQETMMTPRSRKPVLLISGTNINNLVQLNQREVMDNVIEETMTSSESEEVEQLECDVKFKKSKSDGEIINKNPNFMDCDIKKQNLTDTPKSLTSTFVDYLNSRDIQTFSTPMDSSFSSQTDDFQTNSTDTISDSLLYCLDGNIPKNYSAETESSEKELVLKPRQFDENGKPIVFETSF